MNTLSEQYKNSLKDFEKNVKKEVNKLLERSGIVMVKETRKLQDDNDNYASRSLSNKTNYKVSDKGVFCSFCYIRNPFW